MLYPVATKISAQNYPAGAASHINTKIKEKKTTTKIIPQ